MPNSFERAFNPAFQSGTALASRLFEQDRAEKLRLLEQDRVEKLFDTRLAEQRKYTVMQGLISEAENLGVPANDIANLNRNGDLNAFRSILEKGRAHFAAGSSPEPTVPTEEQSGSPSYLHGQRLRDRGRAIEDIKADAALRVVTGAENRATNAAVKRTEDDRRYQALQAFTNRAIQAGMNPETVSDIERIGDLDLYSAMTGEAEQDYSAGLSFVNADPTPGQLLSPSFQKGRLSRDNKEEERKRAALVSAEANTATQQSAVEIAGKRADIVSLRERGRSAGMPQEFMNDLEKQGDLSMFTVYVREAETDYRDGISSSSDPTPEQANSPSFIHGRQMRTAAKVDNDIQLAYKYEQDQKVRHERKVDGLQGSVSGIQGVPDKLRRNLFSRDPVVRDKAFWDISENTIQTTGEDRNGNPTVVFRYVITPPPSPLPAKPKPDEIMSELTIFRKLPIINYPKGEEELLNSNDQKVWGPALERIKRNTTRKPNPGIGAQPTYHWTPGSTSFPLPKPSLQIPSSTNSLPLLPGSLDHDTDPR